MGSYIVIGEFIIKQLTYYHKRLLQKFSTLSNGVSSDVDPISTCNWRLIKFIHYNIITCLLVALCLVTVSLICLTSALVIPPMTNKRIQSLVAGRGRAELMNKLYITYIHNRWVKIHVFLPKCSLQLVGESFSMKL